MAFDVPVPVDQVVVTAARLPAAASDAAFSIIQLDEGELVRARRVDEALAAVPAVSLFRRTSSLSANPTIQGISLRAIAPSGAGRALVTLDGVPMNDPFGGWVIWSQAVPEALSGVDIVRGAGAGAYGAGALTGVVGLRERDSGLVADLSAGGLGSVRAAAATVQSLGTARLFASGLYERSDGYVPVRGARRGAADTPTDLRARSFALRLDLPTRVGTLSVRGGAYDDARGAGLALARAKAKGEVLSVTLARAPTAAGAPGWRLQAWRRSSDLANSAVAVAPDRQSVNPANSQDGSPATGEGFNAALRVRTGRMELEVGADARFTEGEARERFRYVDGAYSRTRLAGGRTSVVGGYLDGAWTEGSWLVAGGVRLDAWRNGGAKRIERVADLGTVLLDERPRGGDGRIVSARFGLRHELGEGFAWRASTYSGFRPPNLNELHRPFRVGNDLTEANAALRPERLHGAEFGIVRRSTHGLVELTAFWNRIEDPIANVTVGFGPGTFARAGFVPAGGVLRERRNAGRIDAVGLEGRAERRIGPATLSLAAAFTDARVDGGGAAPQLTGKRPAQAARWSGVAGMDLALSETLRLSGDLTYEGPRFEDDLNRRVLGRAVRLDARLTWRLKRDLSAYVAADNLLGAKVPTSRTADGVVGYAAPRIVRIGLRLQRDFGRGPR